MTDAQKAAELSVRIEALRAGLAAAERKRDRIDFAITTRRQLLSKLESQLVLLAGGSGPVRTNAH
jgi:hypothetical protein